MERFYGFDLGDAESAVSRLEKGVSSPPEILSVEGEKSFISAYAVLPGGRTLLGEKACYNGQAIKRKLRFKSRFLSSADSKKDIRTFAGSVLASLADSLLYSTEKESCFYIGCPAGWNKNEREQYRTLFEQAGYPPVKVVSESRAALVSACQSRHLQVGYDILSRPVLVIDIGSSTTDFAYINSGKEVELQTAGEVALGGGLMDELLLDKAIEESGNREELYRIFEESEPWKTYCEFAARKLKEKFYSDPEYWSENECKETVLVCYDRPLRLTIRMDEKTADYLENKPMPSLNDRSFRKVFGDSMEEAKKNVAGRPPELLFLTGGVSRLPALQEWCRQAFPEAVVITGTEPEFSVARGLAWCGKIDEELREFRKELEELIDSDVVERIVRSHIRELYRNAVDALTEPMLTACAPPVFERWRSGEIVRLCDTEQEMEKEIAAWVRGDEARELLLKVVKKWMKGVADEIEEYTVPICIRHHIPYTALSLNSYLSLSELELRIEAKNLFAVEEFTLMIDSVLTIIVGLLCGGSGITLIASGPAGVVAGILLSLAVLFLGKGKMEEAFMKVNIPVPMRKLIPEKAFQKRIKAMSSAVKESFYEVLTEEKSEEITTRMAEEISGQIELCLLKMAEVVEIPLG